MAFFRDLNNVARETSACRSWVMFDGTGTISIKQSFNISSIGDSGTGFYRVNLTNAHPNNLYLTLVTGTAGQTSGGSATLDTVSFNGQGVNTPNSSTSYQIRGVTGSGSNADHAQVHTATWRED